MQVIFHVAVILSLVYPGAYAASLEINCSNGQKIIPLSVAFNGSSLLTSGTDVCLESARVQFMKTCWGQTTCVVNTDGIDCISKVIVLNYKCMTDDTIIDICTATVPNIPLGMKEFLITTPGYPNTYPKGTYCRTFKLPKIVDNLFYKLTLLDLEMDYNEPNCRDKLYMYSLQHGFNYHLCGTMNNMTSTLPASKYLHFQSGSLEMFSDDFDLKKRGFALRVQVVADPSASSEPLTTEENLSSNESSSTRISAALGVILMSVLISYMM